MKEKILFVSFVFCLAIFGAVHPGLADSSNEPPAGLLGNMQQEGWQLVGPGVLQRHLENNKVETLGFGAEGLRFKLDEMKAHYAFLRAELERQPDNKDLRRAIRAHRAEILRTAAALENAKSMGDMGSLSEKTAAGIDCTIKYGAHVNAFHLTGGSPGVGATTDSYFNSNCGQTGEVYAHAYSKATGADNVIRTATHSDPANQVPRYGGNVTASTSNTVVGVRDCYSYSYATMTSYDLGVTYSQSVSNSACPNPLNVSVYVDYSYIQLYGYDCQTVTWTASVSGGAAPYSYTWSRDGSYAGSGPSYSEMFCGNNYSWSYSVNATATVTDNSTPGQSGSASALTSIYTYANSPNCDYRYEFCAQQPLD
ncbi:MAG TPA: hypothetical protein VLQ45_01410 [Thermoanaerobaculia bacterium]|nr:hypothetical protein [Thermoanaerobaculia bacterium]